MSQVTDMQQAQQPAGADQSMPDAAPSSSQQQQPPTIDMNALATFMQQYNNQQKPAAAPQANGSPGIPEALAAAISKGLGGGTTNLSRDAAAPSSAAAPKDSAEPPGGASGGTDAQHLMEQIASLTKSLENEKVKSKALQEEKKREMKGFLNGIQNYVNSLDGVKDPNAKGKFMEGMQNMANNGVPNGVYDIMVSASAQNEHNMKTIEALTKGYTELKEKYEGPGQFASESSRFVDPTLHIIGAGAKRKTVETESEKVPVGMWDFFGETVAAAGYATQPDLLSGQ